MVGCGCCCFVCSLSANYYVARRHRDGQRGRDGLQEAGLHRDWQGAALQSGPTEREEGRDLLLQGVFAVLIIVGLCVAGASRCCVSLPLAGRWW